MKWKSFAFALVFFLMLSACNENKPQDAQIQQFENGTESNVNSTAEIESEEKDSDFDIIMREGHPTYYGSVNKSHYIWDDVEKGKIKFADSSGKFENTTILSMEAARNSNLIKNIYICFSNFQPSIQLTIEDVLPIVASYIPFQIIEEYYELRNTELIVPDEGNIGSKYYIISYGLTEHGKKARKEKEHNYSGSIDIVIEESPSGTIKNFNVDFGTPRWMSSLSINSYHTEEWECFLSEYQEK